MEKPQNTVIVIFGASGDLVERKLIPALYHLSQYKLMPEKYVILGTGRKQFNDNDFRDKISKSDFFTKKTDAHSLSFIKKLHFESINTNEAADYKKLKQRIEALRKDIGIEENHLFYFSTPPEAYLTIASNLASVGFNKAGQNKLIIEKPFGSDLASAISLNESLLALFPEESIYRIDHFLGKETVQNLLVTRFGNIIFEPVWNRTYIDHVQITAAESIGIESRGDYYNKSGALRDMVQNHLLQLLGIVAMEPPVSIDASNIRNETMKVFKALRPHTEASLRTDIIRGQYTKGMKDGEKTLAYLEEEGIPPGSNTESFVALKLFIDNWRWKDVPFYIRTGKRMEARVTEIVIHFKKTPHHIFVQGQHTNANANQLIIRIQPDEGMLVKFGVKVPGAGFSVTEKNLLFHYADDTHVRLPDAYERLLLDSLNDDATLYSRADAVKETWQYIDPILKFWEANPKHNLHPYKPASWGPEEAHQLLNRDDRAWRNPCSGLEDDFCSL